MEACEFWEITERDLDRLLLDTCSWRVFLSENQSYFGRCTVLLKRHCGSLSELGAAEWDDLRSVVIRLER